MPAQYPAIACAEPKRGPVNPIRYRPKCDTQRNHLAVQVSCDNQWALYRMTYPGPENPGIWTRNVFGMEVPQRGVANKVGLFATSSSNLNYATFFPRFTIPLSDGILAVSTNPNVLSSFILRHFRREALVDCWKILRIGANNIETMEDSLEATN